LAFSTGWTRRFLRFNARMVVELSQPTTGSRWKMLRVPARFRPQSPELL
jgi:hypothetical protein